MADPMVSNFATKLYRRHHIYHAFRRCFADFHDDNNSTTAIPIIRQLRTDPELAYEFYRYLYYEYVCEYMPDLTKITLPHDYGMQSWNAAVARPQDDIGLFLNETLTRHIIYALNKSPIKEGFSEHVNIRRSGYIDKLGGQTICCSAIIGRKIPRVDMNEDNVRPMSVVNNVAFTDNYKAVGIGLFNMNCEDGYFYPLMNELNATDIRSPKNNTLLNTTLHAYPNDPANFMRYIESCFLVLTVIEMLFFV